DGDDVIVGDGAHVYRTSGIATLVESRDVFDEFVYGDVDTITGAGGKDVVIGGAGGDKITAGLGGDIIIGDQGTVVIGGDVTTTHANIGSRDEITGEGVGSSSGSIRLVDARNALTTGTEGEHTIVRDSGDVHR